MNSMKQFKKSDMPIGTLVKTPKQVTLTGKDDHIGKAINAFLRGDVGKFGNYVAVKNALVYRTVTKEHYEFTLRQDIIAIRLPTGDMVGNSSVLQLIGRTVSFGNVRNNRGVTEVQRRLSQVIPTIPFTVFAETGLDLNKYKLIDKGVEETIVREIDNPKYSKYDTKASKLPKKIEETVHFTGASLFEVDGVKFLFDIDRREIKHKIFNPFLVKLTDTSVNTIADAYESLKPEEVKNAEKSGLEVKRQGEWFFIPVKGDYEPVKPFPNRWDKRQFEPLTLRAGNNRPNRVSKYANVKTGRVVTGLVEHSGREHAGLVLKGWYKPVPNTATESFTITGDVD